MMNKPLHALRDVPRPVGYAIALVLFAMAGFALYAHWSRDNRPPVATRDELDQRVTLRCTNPACGQVVQTTVRDLLDKGSISPMELTAGPLVGEGRRCPHCGQYTLEVAQEPPSPPRKNLSQ